MNPVGSRTRMTLTQNTAFQELKEHIPSEYFNQDRPPKIEILNKAIRYINDLDKILTDSAPSLIPVSSSMSGRSVVITPKDQSSEDFPPYRMSIAQSSEHHGGDIVRVTTTWFPEGYQDQRPKSHPLNDEPIASASGHHDKSDGRETATPALEAHQEQSPEERPLHSTDDVRAAFQELREHIPSEYFNQDQPLQIKILDEAILYINDLDKILADSAPSLIPVSSSMSGRSVVITPKDQSSEDFPPYRMSIAQSSEHHGGDIVRVTTTWFPE